MGYVLKLERGEELHQMLIAFTSQKLIPSACYQGIGSICDIELGYFNMEKNGYSRRSFKGTHELINITGNISIEKGKYFAHSHVVLANEKNETISGHFFKGRVTVTAEIFLFHVDIALNRKKDKKLNFMGLDLPHLFVQSDE